uniref:PDZ domain-containing protein n=1 Tax=Ciona savignyi TaxID=51511 RepID=H2ZEM0_CIOSA
EEERGEAVVNLVKVEGIPLGLTVSGGADKEGRPRVSNLRASGIAARSDQLQVGDTITSVNGIRSTKLKHGEIISLLKNISERVCLEIEYLLPPTSELSRTTSIIQKTTEIFLRKENDSFGFVLRGGNHGQHCRSRPLVVTHIRPDSPAAKEGTLKTGDRIVSVGSTPLISSTLPEAIAELQGCGEEAVLTIEYDVSVMDAVANASGPLLVEVSKDPGAELGITLAKSTYRKKPVICIDRVKPASISDRCGALHIGDQILSIDNISMATSSVREASDLLQSSSDQVKLEIHPVPHNQRYVYEITRPLLPHFPPVRCQPCIPSDHPTYLPKYICSNVPLWRDYLFALRSRLSRSNPHFQFHQSNSTTLPLCLRRTRLPQSPLGDAPGTPGFSPRGQCRSCRRSATGSLMSLASADYLSNNQVVHTEVTEVQLLASDDIIDPMTSSALPNFGMQLQGGIFSTEVLTSPPFISFIEPDRPADRCGVLQSGDRLMSVNGYPCEDCTLDEVAQMLGDAYLSGAVTINRNFKIEPKDFCFKLRIMITNVQASTLGYVETRLNITEKYCCDLMCLPLHVCNALISLLINPISPTDEGERGFISYTVELKRHGGPLGITISGTEEAFDPIIISGLTPGGLADRWVRFYIGGLPLEDLPIGGWGFILGGSFLHIIPIVTSQSEPITELSDPEDDILPPPMGPLPNHTPTDPPSDPLHRLKGRGVRPGPAGAASVDSAVDSWGDSDAYRTRSSTGGCGLFMINPGKLTTRDISHVFRHLGDTRPYSVANQPIPRAKVSLKRRSIPHPTTNPPPHAATNPPAPAPPVAEWQRALDDLQSVGQSSGYLHDLESKLTIGSEALGRHPVYNHRRRAVAKNSASPSLPLRFHRLTLFKESLNEDFGFSLSDGQIEPGVFVHTVRHGGPAHRCGLLPFDRLLQVNGTTLHDSDCTRAIPVVSGARERLDVLVSRHPGNPGVITSHPLLSPPVDVSPHLR